MADPAARLRVAYQGSENAYSYLAARAHVGPDAVLVGCRTFRDAAHLVRTGAATLAVLPIENTTAGSIAGVYDVLRAEQVSIVGEQVWRVDHCLAARTAVPVSSLRRILSHPQALEQCSDFLASLPECEAVSHIDTAGALAEVSAGHDPTVAAIGPPEAVQALGLVVLRRGIANQAENYTRFVVLAAEPRPVPPGAPAKTSLILVTSHEHGALVRCLTVLSQAGVSMSKLESRPRPGRPWEYMFFLDFEGDEADPVVARALEDLRAAAVSVTVLGSYPAAPRPP